MKCKTSVRWMWAPVVLATLLSVGCNDEPDSTVRVVPSTDAQIEVDMAPPVVAADMGPPAALEPWHEVRRWYPENPLFCVQGAAENDPFGALLDALRLTEDLGIPRLIYEAYGGYIDADPGRRSWFHRLQRDVLGIPCFSGQAAARADKAVDGDHLLTAMIADAAAMADAEVEVGGTVTAEADARTLMDILDALQGGSDWAGRADWAQQEAALPAGLQTTLKRVLFAALGAHAHRDEALATLDPSLSLDVLFRFLPNSYFPSNVGRLNNELPAVQDAMIPKSAAALPLYRGATYLAQGLDEAELDALMGADHDVSFELETPKGWIIVRGAGDDLYDPDQDPRLRGPILLLIDLGGDDTYLIPAGATVNEDHGVSVHIDLGGNDVYGYREVPGEYEEQGLLVSDAAGRYEGDEFWGHFSLSSTPRQGSGVLGYGFLIDLGEGTDEYRTLRYGQGFGAFGVGVLYDDGGGDRYTLEAGGQGTGFGGLGLLIDHGGDDRYRAFYSAQAHGRPGGVGVLYDAQGNDDYTLEPTKPQVYNWFPGFEHNLSMGQGASTGARNLEADKVSLSGGFALLRDREGDDEYMASVMSQGEGYWMGVGILADAAGDDRYNALVYSQGSSQHFAVGVFLEGGGDDVYNDVLPIQHALPGLSHDFSVSVFIEDGGNDTYKGASGSFGAGKCHGLSLFIDNGGDDDYSAANFFSLGWAKDFDGEVGSCGDWTMVPTYGLFIDADGDDTYDKGDDDLGDIRQDGLWITDDPRDDTALELSGGVDRTGPPTSLRAYGSAYFAEVDCESGGGLAELCDGRDQDCDGQVDEGLTGCERRCAEDGDCTGGFCGADQNCFHCPAVTLMVTDQHKQDLEQLTLNRPRQSEVVEVQTPEGRRQRLEVVYNATCTDVSVRSLESRNSVCFDFAQGPCDLTPETNCSGYLRYRVNGKSGVLEDVLQCANTPEAQGWQQYDRDVTSCYPAYAGPMVTRFNVNLRDFPPCDDAVRGQAWCTNSEDQSPSRCLNCERSLYVCQ